MGHVKRQCLVYGINDSHIVHVLFLQLLMDVARHKNKTPLPLIKPYTGPKLPPDRYCLSSANYRLKSLKKVYRFHSTLTKVEYTIFNHSWTKSISWYLINYSGKLVGRSFFFFSFEIRNVNWRQFVEGTTMRCSSVWKLVSWTINTLRMIHWNMLIYVSAPCPDKYTGKAPRTDSSLRHRHSVLNLTLSQFINVCETRQKPILSARGCYLEWPWMNEKKKKKQFRNVEVKHVWCFLTAGYRCLIPYTEVITSQYTQEVTHSCEAAEVWHLSVSSDVLSLMGVTLYRDATLPLFKGIPIFSTPT